MGPAAAEAFGLSAMDDLDSADDDEEGMSLDQQCVNLQVRARKPSTVSSLLDSNC